MKKFIEEYGFAILAAIIIIILIMMATPIGSNVRIEISRFINKLCENTSSQKKNERLVSVELSADPNLTITSTSSTDKFDYIIHYQEDGIDKKTEPLPYEEGLAMPNCDENSYAQAEAIDRGTGESFLSNTIKIPLRGFPNSKTYELVDTQSFREAISEENLGGRIGKIHFVDTPMPTSDVTLIEGLDLDGDGGIIGWYKDYEMIHTREDGTVYKKILKDVYISSQKRNQKTIVSDSNVKLMFGGTNFSYAEYYDVGLLDVSNVVNMSHLFTSCSVPVPTKYIIKGLDKWDMSNVTSINSMFKHAGQSRKVWDIGDISGWDTSNVTDARMTFMMSCNAADICDIGDVGKWDVSKLKQADLMFSLFGHNATEKTYIGDLSEWKTDNLRTANSMFANFASNSPNFNIGDISNWNMNNVTDIFGMFYRVGEASTPFTLDLSGWDISNVTNIKAMFHSIGANKIMLPKNISSTVDYKKGTEWNARDVISKPWYDITDNNKEYLPGTFPVGFAESHTLVDINPIKGIFAVYSDDDSSLNFYFDENEHLTEGSVYRGKTITKIYRDFVDKKLDWQNKMWREKSQDIKKVEVVDDITLPSGTIIDLWFLLEYAEEIDVSKLDTKNVVSMEGTFCYAGFHSNNLVLKGLENWNTSNVKNMAQMFAYSKCQINGINNWDVRKVEKLGWQGPGSTWGGIFLNCKADYIDTSKWELDNCMDLSNMFSGLKIGATVKIPKYIRSDAKTENFFSWVYGKEIKWVNNETGKEYIFSDTKYEMPKLLKDEPWGQEFTLHLIKSYI